MNIQSLFEAWSEEETRDLAKRIAEVAQCSFIIQSLVPLPSDKPIQAAAILPGVGQRQRVVEGLAVANHFGATTIICAGQHEADVREHGELAEQILRDLQTDTSLPTTTVISTPLAEHSKEQAEFVLRNIKRRGIQECLLMVPGWHLTRMYLTFVASALKDPDVSVKLRPYPVAAKDPIRPPHASGGLSIWSAAEGELVRCIEYQKKGDVAGLAGLRTYLERVSLL